MVVCQILILNLIVVVQIHLSLLWVVARIGEDGNNVELRFTFSEIDRFSPLYVTTEEAQSFCIGKVYTIEIKEVKE